MNRILWIFLLLAGTAAPLAAAQTRTTELGAYPLTYTIDWRKARQAHVIAEITLPASEAQLWAVLTDYDHLEEFVPYLAESQVLRREPGRLLLRQQGNLWMPFYRLKTEAVLWVEENPPHRLLFKAVDGDFLIYDGSWRLEPAEGGTRLTYEATIEPKFWVPRWVLWEVERRILKGTFRAILRRAIPEPSPDS